PEAGGLYVYVRDAFGRFPAFLLGWTFLFVIGPGAVATLSVAFTSYFERLVPLGPVWHHLVPVLMIAVLALVNVRGTRQSARMQNLSTAIKVGALLAMGVAFLALGHGLRGLSGRVWPASFSLSLASGIGLAMVGVLWAYEGWQYVTFSAGEAERPERTFPAGITIGTLAIVAIYALANVAYIAAIGPDAVAASPAVAAESVRALFGPAAETLIALAIMVSMYSAANGLTMTTPRIYYRMGRDGVFFRRLGDVHPRFGTPAIAIIVSSLWAMLLAATGTFEQLLTYVVFAGWIFYALGAASIFVFRRRLPDAPRPFRVPGYPVTPARFVLASAAIVLNTLFSQPGRALVGLAIVALGSPAYLIWRARQDRPAAATAGD
ncbi:MAG TPA: amino acid permease, partial [Longimicrobiales bacterium]